MSFNRYRGPNGFTTDAFLNYVERDLVVPSWVRGITVHHTWSPTESGWKGAKSLDALERFYAKERGWHKGPHAYVAPDKWWLFTPFHDEGVHAIKFNPTHWGIEVVHNGDASPFSGPLAQNLYAGLSALFHKANLDPRQPGALTLHRDDPKAYKTCPGLKVSRSDILSGILSARCAPGESVRIPRHFEDGTDIPLRIGGAPLHGVHGEQIDGTTYVPLRAFVESLGGKVVVSTKPRFFGATLGAKTVDLTQEVEIDGGTAWVHIRPLCEGLGLSSVWNPKDRCVDITSEKTA
jgi:hypothetical protein